MARLARDGRPGPRPRGPGGPRALRRAPAARLTRPTADGAARGAGWRRALADRWFHPPERGWHPELYEWSFTRNPVDAAVRAREERAVLGAVDRALRPEHRALDLGAGTGHYTVALAGRCREVVAADASDAMLAYLRRRVAAEALANVRTVRVALAQLAEGERDFDLVLAVGLANYLPDLGATFAGAAAALRAGGRAVLTVPHRTPEGRFYALGERLGRRRVWLHGAGEVRRAAAGAGLEVVGLASVGLTRRGFNLVLEARRT